MAKDSVAPPLAGTNNAEESGLCFQYKTESLHSLVSRRTECVCRLPRRIKNSLDAKQRNEEIVFDVPVPAFDATMC